jgi:hypothetical protein
VVAEVGELYVAADLPGGYVESHKSAQAAAIDSSDIAKVQHDLDGFAQQVLHMSAQKRRFLVKGYSAAETDDDDAIYTFVGDVKCHDMSRHGVYQLRGNLRGPAEPLASKGNPRPFFRESYGSRPGLAR